VAIAAGASSDVRANTIPVKTFWLVVPINYGTGNRSDLPAGWTAVFDWITGAGAFPIIRVKKNGQDDVLIPMSNVAFFST
jgi:hypothetical protein